LHATFEENILKKSTFVCGNSFLCVNTCSSIKTCHIIKENIRKYKILFYKNYKNIILPIINFRNIAAKK